MITNFDQRAQGWDDDRRCRRADIIAAALRNALPDKRPLTGMEYGCGTGLVGLRLADAFDALLLVDASAGMLFEADQKLAANDLRHVTTQQLNLLDEQPVDLTFDCIFLSMVLHHIPQAGAILRALFRLTAPGGRLLIVDLFPVARAFHQSEPDFSGHNGFDPTALAAALEAAGFCDTAWDTVFCGQKDVDGHNRLLAVSVTREQAQCSKRRLASNCRRNRYCENRSRNRAANDTTNGMKNYKLDRRIVHENCL